MLLILGGNHEIGQAGKHLDDMLCSEVKLSLSGSRHLFDGWVDPKFRKIHRRVTGW
jgi:hypothetical protein